MNEYKFEDCHVNLKASFNKIVTAEMMETFYTLTGDINPLHNDDIFAQSISNGKYHQRVCYGMLTASFLSTLAGVYLPGKYCIIHGINIDFVKPVFIGDNLLIEGIIKEKSEATRQLIIKITIKNQKGDKVLRGSMKTGVVL